MRIAYYGNFEFHSTENYIADAMERQGVKVERLQKMRMSPNSVSYATKHADFLMFAKLEGAIPKSYCPTVCWLFDLYFNLPDTFFRDPTREHAFRADHVFTTDGGDPEKWEKLKVNHKTLRQGVDIEGKYEFKKNYEYDVAFVGGVTYPYRARLLNFLKKNYKTLHIQDRYAHNLNHALSKVKIVVGDSIPSPGYWSNRVYEVTGRGGFIIHPRVEGLDVEFPDLVQYEYGNFDELKEKIDYYLKNEKEREAIRKKCHKICPTYDDRVKELCKLLNQKD